MTVVVTGAAGHLGGNLVRALLRRGCSVRALVHRDKRVVRGLNVELVQGDVRDASSLRCAFDGAEVVYHAAAHVSIRIDEWPLLHAVNVLGTRNVVESCLHCGVRRLIHFSSIHALDLTPTGTPVDESRPTVDAKHNSPYARSKAAGEKEVQKGIAQGLDAVILNPTALFGPYDHRPSHFGEVLLALSGGRFPALIEGGFDWADVRDVVEGAIESEERAPAGFKYVLSGHWVSVRDLARSVQAITGTRAPRLVCPLGLARIGAPVATVVARLIGRRPLFTAVALDALRSNREISHARATQDLNYRPRPFEETLVDTLQWFEKAGYFTRPLAKRPVEVG